MRLYIRPHAPNVLRVAIVAHEKGITLDLVDASTDPSGYRAINPFGQVPALVLDDGRIVTESLTICQYLDATGDGPALFGDDPAERLAIAMWERRAEFGLFLPTIEYGHHVHPMFATATTQIPAYAATLLPRANEAADIFARTLERSAYVAGDRVTAADVTALLGCVLLTAYGALERSARGALTRWGADVLARDSLATVRQTAAAFGIAASI